MVKMYNINNPKFVYQIVPDERRWQSQQNTFLIVFVKFSTTHNRLVLVCDLTNVVQIYVNNFTVTDNASSKGSFVSALNSKGPLSSSSRRTNWTKISTRKICHCWWRNHTGCVRDRDQDQYCAETFYTGCVWNQDCCMVFIVILPRCLRGSKYHIASHSLWPEPRPWQGPGTNGLYETVWKLSYYTRTRTGPRSNAPHCSGSSLSSCSAQCEYTITVS